MGTPKYIPKVRYRVLATDWEGESYIECWTEDMKDAETIQTALKALKGGDVTVQVDQVLVKVT